MTPDTFQQQVGEETRARVAQQLGNTLLDLCEAQAMAKATADHSRDVEAQLGKALARVAELEQAASERTADDKADAYDSGYRPNPSSVYVPDPGDDFDTPPAGERVDIQA